MEGEKNPSAAAVAAAQSVSMRDVGTEMAPSASQAQSRSGTPAGAATPSLSPLCSVPASPSASERELRVRTRREIAALGMQLGKMSIASWASKDDRILASPDKSAGAGGKGETKKEKFEARAAAWAESQKCKLASRYQRKEVKIQEREDCQKSKFEAKMRRAEVQADQMKARAKSSPTKRLSNLGHGAAGGADSEDRPSAVTVPLLQLVPVMNKAQDVSASLWTEHDVHRINAVEFVHETITGLFEPLHLH